MLHTLCLNHAVQDPQALARQLLIVLAVFG